MTTSTDSRFFDAPILNNPYEYPTHHWELDKRGQPTQRVADGRRPAQFITPIPKPKKVKGSGKQKSMVLDEGLGLSTEQQQYATIPIINELRSRVDEWRKVKNPDHWGVTPETAPPLGALAEPPVRRDPAVFLPGRSGRDGHLADGGRSERPHR